MSRPRAIILFAAVFAATLVLTFPMGMALRWAGADAAGLSARAVTGDVWTGKLAEARIGPVPLGNANAGLRPLPLLTGTAELGADMSVGFGRITASSTTRGLRRVTAKLPLATTLSPLPVETIELAEATMVFRGATCAEAEGRVRATFGMGNLAGLNLSQGMSGIARCDGGALLLPLVSQTGLEKLTLRLRGNGQWTALLSVQGGDPAMMAKLVAAGFTNAGGAMVLRLNGGI
jgi:general secretion pathway protein N